MAVLILKYILYGTEFFQDLISFNNFNVILINYSSVKQNRKIASLSI